MKNLKKRLACFVLAVSFIFPAFNVYANDSNNELEILEIVTETIYENENKVLYEKVIFEFDNQESFIERRILEDGTIEIRTESEDGETNFATSHVDSDEVILNDEVIEITNELSISDSLELPEDNSSIRNRAMVYTYGPWQSYTPKNFSYESTQKSISAIASVIAAATTMSLEAAITVGGSVYWILDMCVPNKYKLYFTSYKYARSVSGYDPSDSSWNKYVSYYERDIRTYTYADAARSDLKQIVYTSDVSQMP